MRSHEILRHLLGTPVRVRGVLGGHVSGVLIDGGETHAIGLEVTSVDRARRFLPWVAAHFADGVVDADSPFLLVDSADTYLDRGAIVKRDAEELGQLVADARGLVTDAAAPASAYPRPA